jgi:hypothetical protein
MINPSKMIFISDLKPKAAEVVKGVYVSKLLVFIIQQGRLIL